MGTLSNQLKVIREQLDNVQKVINEKYQEMDMQPISSLVMQDLEQRVQDIPVLNTSDATATNEDILKNKTAYIKGEQVSGRMNDYSGNENEQWLYTVANDETIGTDRAFTCNATTSGYIDENTKLMISMPQITKWGLTPDMIVKNQEFMGIIGTGETGIDTSNATATASDILKNKTAYVNGKHIVGRMRDYSGSENYQWLYTVANNESSGTDRAFTCHTTGSGYIDENTNIMITISQIAKWGLTPDIIVSGKEFMGIVGTGGAGSGTSDTSDATATANDILSGKTAYVNGEKITGNINTWRTTSLDVDSKYATGLNIKLKEGYYPSNATVTLSFNEIVQAIGLTADIIKKGEVVLGITGTHECSTEDTPDVPDVPVNPDIEIDEEDPSVSYYNADTLSYRFRPGYKWGGWETIINHSGSSYNAAYMRMYNAHFFNGTEYGYFCQYNNGDKTYHRAHYTTTDGQKLLTCYIADLNLTIDECAYLYKILRYDCPELIMKHTNFRYFINASGYVSYLLFDTFDETVRQGYKDTIFDTFKDICTVIKQQYSNINTDAVCESFYASVNEAYYSRNDKVKIAKVIHDYLVLHNTYHESSVPNLDQTLYPAMSNGRETPVCASYAHAFQWCCQKFGIWCNVISGQTASGEKHMWNMICYENYGGWGDTNSREQGNWSECDVTWDDPTDGGPSYCRWTFFNVTTDVMKSPTGDNRVRAMYGVTSFGNEAYEGYIVDKCTCTSYTYSGNTKYGGL